MTPKRIALIKAGSYSNLNGTVAQVLKQQFPNRDIDVIDIYDLIKQDKRFELMNLVETMREYGVKALRNKKKFLRYFLLTTYVFNRIKEVMPNYISPKHHAFSFQTQSFFDASVSDVPHFVYTDDTLLVHLYNRDVKKSGCLPPSRIALEKRVYRNASVNFTLSHQIERSLIEQYACSPENIICIGAGSNLKNDGFVSSYLRRPKHILFVGVDWERKGGPELVEAFKIVLKHHPDAHLTIVGCSPAIDTDNCQVVGRIPVDQVDQYYEAASIFCLPTKQEPFGTVFIEAFSYSLPIVASNVGGLADFIRDGENGYVIQPNSSQQIANALCDLLENPERAAEFGRNGYRLAAERFSWKTIGSKIRETIEPLINSVVAP